MRYRDNADDFIAAHQLSDMLLKISLGESASRNHASFTDPLPELPTGKSPCRGKSNGFSEFKKKSALYKIMFPLTELSSGLLTFAQFGPKDTTGVKVQFCTFKHTFFFFYIIYIIPIYFFKYIFMSFAFPVYPLRCLQLDSLPTRVEEDNVRSEGVDSDHFSGSNLSFLANEKLMSIDSINSDLTGATPGIYSCFIICHGYTTKNQNNRALLITYQYLSK